MADNKLSKRNEEDRNCDGDCIKTDLERVGEEWENDRQEELENADRERSMRKVRGRKQTMEKEIMVNSPLTTVMPTKTIITTKCNFTLV